MGSEIKLGLATLQHLDFGKVDVATDHHLKLACKDCMDRPGDKTARTVALIFILTPEPNQDGTCEKILLDFQIKPKLPPHRSRTFQCAPRVNGDMVFQPDSPDDVNQLGFGGPDGP